MMPPHPQIAPRRPAFTLIEMLVSLAVMTIALAVVGVVFATTSRAATQGAAYSEAHNAARQFVAQLEEDLRYVDPAQSVLLLTGRMQAAALTQDRLEAGQYHRVQVGNSNRLPNGYDPQAPGLDGQGVYSDPRGDIITFITQRPLASAAPPPNPHPVRDAFGYAAAGGVMFAPSLITYGHAALGRPVWNGSGYEYPADIALQHISGAANRTLLSRVPLNRWHLARRATILAPGDAGNDIPSFGDYDEEVRRGIMRGEWYNVGSRMPGDAAYFDLSRLLAILGADALRYGNTLHPANYAPYGWNNADLSTWPRVGDFGDDCTGALYSLMFPLGHNNNFHVATVLEDLPVDLKGNMAVQMLPGCAWFQVEFLMAEDPRNSLVYSNPDPNNPNDWSSRSDMPLWTAIPDGAMYAFLPDTAHNRAAIASQVDANGVPLNSDDRLATFALVDPSAPVKNTVDNRIIRLWPYAVRITVHVYDSRGRLEQPVIRSVVHRFE